MRGLRFFSSEQNQKLYARPKKIHVVPLKALETLISTT